MRPLTGAEDSSARLFVLEPVLAESSQIGRIDARAMVGIGTVTMRQSAVVFEPVAGQDTEVQCVHDAVQIEVVVVVIRQIEADTVQPKRKTIIPRVGVDFKALHF